MVYYDDALAEEAVKVCKVYDKEDFFTVFVLMLLAAAALLSLWFKRQSERPRRKFRTWFLDVSKQGLGACYAHVANMVCFYRLWARCISFFVPPMSNGKMHFLPRFHAFLTFHHVSLYRCRFVRQLQLLSLEIFGVKESWKTNVLGMECAIW